MAVQAQYPSNVLLLNSKTVQEGHEYSLQPQQSGGLLDQSHMFYNGASNSRKRGRSEATESPNPRVSHTAPPSVIINQLSCQSKPLQLIDLTQLHNPHQQNAVSTGLRLSFCDQHLQQEQQFGLQSSALTSMLSEGLASQIKQQRDETDQFLQAQGEELRRAIAEKRQRHYRSLLSAAEESVARRLREKEAEVERATRRNAELEARAAQLSMEAQVWQAKVKAQEATAAFLQTQLHHAIMSGGGQEKRGEDGGGGLLSCAVGVGGEGGQAEDAESAYVDPERAAAVAVAVAGVPKCRGCGYRVASVVVLPCRHLCVCTECDRHFRACPVCLTVKNSTVEVCLS